MRIIGTLAATLGLLASTFAFAGDAEARGRHFGHPHFGHHHHGAPFVVGALGFTAGAIFGSALAGPRYYCGPARGYCYYPYAYPGVVVLPDPAREGGDAK
jgi:hypothetical protein